MLGGDLESREAIVVLGAAVRADGTGSPALLRRVDGALHLHRQRSRIVVVSGGGAGPLPEADVMAAALRRAGVADTHIVREGKSANTAENAAFVAALIGDLPVLVVTDGYHMRRAVREFRRHFASVQSFPVHGGRRSRWVGRLREGVRPFVMGR